VFYVELGKENNMRRALFQKFMSLFLGLTITFAESTSTQATDDLLDTSFGSIGIVTTDFIGATILQMMSMFRKMARSSRSRLVSTVA
jgi:hypothetical protein